ncbi:formate dehydrogenase accessory sulfurtransferase FdhD [Microbacterium sp. NPDC058062]|uniref:formate dehydrogenase accessory sulfurtransferase FdhD n=1 Tax=Microbacterium sp. NPDC058062 TaxID=3346320 RepID=UPI0036DA5019
MGRITARSPVTRIALNDGDVAVRRRADTLVVEEPLEICVSGEPITVTMRTPGNDIELAAGFLTGEGVIRSGRDFRSAIHCGGPGTGASLADGTASNTYNVLDVTLAAEVAPAVTDIARKFYTTSSCGVCGTASIEAIQKQSPHDVEGDGVTFPASWLAGLPDALRAGQAVFDKTGGLHAAALFDAASGELLVLREDVGRHNAVDKVIGWAVLEDLLPLSGTVLQVSGRASFELVQKAIMAGIPALSAVSAPSSLAVELAAASGLTLVGFSRGTSLNVYSRPGRIRM